MMRSSTSRRRPSGATADHPRTDEVVAALVSSGLVEAARAGEAHQVIGSALSAPSVTETPLRRRLAEVAGYVGGALVVAAAVLFLTQEWGSLSATGRVSTLAAIGVVLFGAALVVLRTGGTDGADGADGGVRRRLASALMTSSAASIGFGAGVLVDASARNLFNVAWLVGSLVALAVAAVGYRLAHCALGQLALAAGAVSAVLAALAVSDLFSDERSELLIAGAFAVLGVVWLVLAERNLWWERNVGLATGCALALFGAQYPLFDSSAPWVGHLMTAAAAAAGVGLYIQTRALPYLVTAVAAVTLVVPEVLLHWTEGSLGTVGALLATGLTLLVASLLGLRLRREVGGPAAPGSTA